MISEKRIWNRRLLGIAVFLAGIFFALAAIAWTNPSLLAPAGAGALKAGAGSIGVGLSLSEDPVSTVTVKGNFAAGNSFALINQTGNASGAIVQGYLGVGTPNPTSRLSVAGGTILGETSLKFLSSANIPKGNTVTQLDESPPTYISITIGSDGLPVIAYVANGLFAKVAKCQTIDCATSVITSIGASQGGTAIAVGADGLPVISYVNNSSTISVYKCGNIDCTSGNGVVVPGTAAPFFTSIAVAPNGYPAIAYRNGSSKLSFISCSSANCSGSPQVNQIDSSDSGQNVSLGIGGDGFPVMSYFVNPNTLRVAHCDNVGCTPPVEITSIDTGSPNDSLGQYSSLTFEENGYPLIAYYGGSTAKTLKVAACKNQACTSSSVYTIDSVIGSHSLGIFASIAIGRHGIPVIVHGNNNTDNLRVTVCGVENCSSPVNWSRDIISTFYGDQPYNSIAIGSDGLPIIAYITTSSALGVFHCGAENCVPYWTRR